MRGNEAWSGGTVGQNRHSQQLLVKENHMQRSRRAKTEQEKLAFSRFDLQENEIADIQMTLNIGINLHNAKLM